MLSIYKQVKCQQHLLQLPKIPQTVNDVQILFMADSFRLALIDSISQASRRIYITALYLENDKGGQDVLDALYIAKQQHPELEIYILVDWHRAQRGRIGTTTTQTNTDWYYFMTNQYPNILVPIYGIPINTREILGVFHLKGFIIDDCVIYSGASLNNVYLHCYDKYRYDRYYFIQNSSLADTMSDFIQNKILTHPAAQRLDLNYRTKRLLICYKTLQLRHILRYYKYDVASIASNEELSVTPLVGLGKYSLLNQTIQYLICSTVSNIILCTPYFNIPDILLRNITNLLYKDKKVEIIVGDKQANDFYIPVNEKFKITGILPYLYEINLLNFISFLQHFIDNGKLTIRLWTDKQNTFHLKGIWIDNEWQLITGSNLNPRSWLLDLENAILIHDPKYQLSQKFQKELECIRGNTRIINSNLELETIQQYPIKVRKLIRLFRIVRIDYLINKVL
ncbi:CDP-diacylglycerol--serine O-phosphatidyltransferase [Candidatus Profftia sp. (ex Adelges kitamiensis)]|uniref:CDP-diacylglycerol--serine O-phosphatidyltransferase n=1 Tax=Candidatus Profftia sp. (ex Adelges kitamiensis) TaxID=2864218 RepID=UPI001CE272A5|nr:CDP-diacylglycerol--serine O-phosphatidyltransferase [Candidatus Profftia sp. (ex Adelges kitamiensis)]